MASFPATLDDCGHNHPDPNMTRPTQREVDIVRSQLVKDPSLTANDLAIRELPDLKLLFCFVLFSLVLVFFGFFGFLVFWFFGLFVKKIIIK